MIPYKYEQPISLGEATLVAKTQGAAIGNGEIYIGANGSPASFYVLDAITGQVKFHEALPGHDVIWAVTVGSDRNVYMSGTQTGILYRYLPQEKRLVNLGCNPSNPWVWDLDASSDGQIYGSTYPQSKVFVYDIQTAQFTDLGTVQEGQDYARGSGVTDRYFYAGIGTKAYLFRFDRMTGQKQEIQLPITGEDSSISNVWSYGGRLFVAYGTSLLVLDGTNHEVVHQMDWQSDHTFDGIISPPSPYNPNILYFRNKNFSLLWIYDLSKDEIAIADSELVLPYQSLKAINWTELKEGPNAGRQVLVMLTNEIEQLIYDPIERSLVHLKPEVLKSGIQIQSLETGPDGNLYMGGYQGAMSVYDTSLGKFTVQEKEPHQIEGIGFLNGEVYLGLYGGAVIAKYVPEQAFEQGVNPRVVYDIDDQQSRPFTFTTGEDKLFIGTIADYGQLGGALTIYDGKADTWTVHRNVIQNQSIIGLAYHNGKIYGGSTLWGGLGIEPSEKEARLFVWDVATATRVSELQPSVPGFLKPKMIGELSFGPDGNLWGIMWGETNALDSAFALFVMDPVTMVVVKSTIVTFGEKGSSWRPFFMRWGADHQLYTTLGRQLIVFDPTTLAYRQLVEGPVNLMTLGLDGSVYYAQAAQLMKLTRQT